MHGGVARPKRFLRRHYSSRRPSGLQGISTGRKSLFSSRNTRTKADKHFGHRLFGKYASSRKSTAKNVTMSNGVTIKRSSARAPKGSKASKASKSKASKASKANASLVNNFVRYAPSAANELAAVEAAKHRSRAAEQASARASRASRGRDGHMRNNNGRAQAASSSRSEAVRSGKRMSLAAVRRALFNAEASHSGHAAAASGPRDPSRLLESQESQESM
jgi:hypothetical protein